MAEIDFGIVNYNGGEALVDCVSSILAMQGVTVRVFICDNASTDGSIKRLQGTSLPVSIDETGKNLGYAGACNRLLLQMDAPVQVLCNMDLTFDSDWGVHVLDVLARNPECGSVASLVVEPNGIVNALGVLFHSDMHAENEGSGKSLSELGALQEKKVFGCYGAVMAFRREVVQTVGLMDESFFLFFEETEWYIKHNLYGYHTLFCPRAVVHHERSKTTVRFSTLKLFYAERNRVRCAIRYLPWGKLLLLPFYSLLRYVRIAKVGIPSSDGSGKKNPKWKLAWTLLSAWIEALVGFPREFRVSRELESRLGKPFRNQVLALLQKYPAPR